MTLVTGGGSGVGRAGAQAFAREGADVVVADLRPERAEAIAAGSVDSRGRATAATVDVAASEQVRRLVDDTVERHGRIDAVFHCAADVPFINARDRRATELPEETREQTLAIHLTGTFLVCKYVGRAMLAQRAGSIILTATADALVGCAGLDAYTAAKGGVVAMTRSLAAGLGPDGIRVNAICPGFVTTEPQMEWMADPERAATLDSLHLLPVAAPEQIAPLAVYLASDESAVATGGIYPIDSGHAAFKARVDVMGAIRQP